ncbi:MAG: SDR family NAD(P)-dependent oxidoreductase [Gammaproteobacteria bacterium]
MNDDLTGRVALVTGAARGIGLVVAEALAHAGASVCGTDVRAGLLSAEMKRIGDERGVKTLAVAADVGVEQQVVDMVGQAVDAFGRIDILINNAGVRDVAPVYATEAETWDAMQSANVRGQFLCTREVLRQSMLDRGEGVIIFVSSGSGIRGERGSSAYCTSKFGVTGFAQSVAKDLKETRIRTSTIMPGMTWTPMAEESEMADADVDWLDAREVANAILFLVRQDSDTIIPELQIYHRTQI